LGNPGGYAAHGLYDPPRRIPKRDKPVYAALDLGTNNCRLLVAVPSLEGFRVIDSFSRITRLGEGLHANGRLCDAAMERTLGALRICAEKVRRHPRLRARYVATEACREAANCASFVAQVERDTGIRLEIISAREEACLAARGCDSLLVPERRYAVIFDIGGGSTEVTWLKVGSDGAIGEPIDSVSMPWGVVRLAEEYGGREISAETYELMVATIRDLLGWFERRHGIRKHLDNDGVQMIGTSGTVTTIAGVHLNLNRYRRDKVDGRLLRFGEIRTIVDRLGRMSFEELSSHPCIGAERADLVLPGCAIMEAILREWPVGRLRVADRGLREGMLYNLIAEDRRLGMLPM
jgi:exopolyphosphatase / guanosine-5'-triphosphate,3'-diphosphate pyrophosphatase